MISVQTIKNSIEELSAITKVELSVYDLTGQLIATTGNGQPKDADMIRNFAMAEVDSQVIGGTLLSKILDEEDPIFVLVTEGSGETQHMVSRIGVSQLQQLVSAYKEHFDRNNFFQNLLLDNLLLIDVYNRAKKLHVDVSGKRVIIVVETKQDHDNTVAELLAGMYTPQGGDYVTAVDESSVVLVKSLAAGDDYTEIDKVATTIADMMNMEAMMNVRVAYGTIVEELKDLSKSYKEAKMALEVGKIFYADRKVNAYSTLGIGRLIYQLPVNLCHMFLEEIFGDRPVLDTLDEETLSTIAMFFDNNLNVSETSRQLFVHRNTLVYRIEKLERATGLDIRKFDDALTFKIALMVSNYMKYLDRRE